MASVKFEVVGMRQWAFEDSKGKLHAFEGGEHEVKDFDPESEFGHGLAAAVDAYSSVDGEFMGEGVKLVSGTLSKKAVQSQEEGENIWNALWLLKGERDGEVAAENAKRAEAGEPELTPKELNTIDKSYVPRMEEVTTDPKKAKRMVDSA